MHKSAANKKKTWLILLGFFSFGGLSSAEPPPFDLQTETPIFNLPNLNGSAKNHEIEKSVANQWVRELRQKTPLLFDPSVIFYIETLIQRLHNASNSAYTDYQILLIPSDSINAFALPGVIGINTGLILNAESEAEVAGVLAHELAHLTQNHFARNLDPSRQWEQQAALLLGLLATAWSKSQDSSAFAFSALAWQGQKQLAFSRSLEIEADQIALHTLRQANFDPNGLSDFFLRLPQSPHAVAFLSTHPLSQERQASIQHRLTASTESRFMQQQHLQTVASTKEFQYIQNRIKKLTNPKNQTSNLKKMNLSQQDTQLPWLADILQAEHAQSIPEQKKALAQLNSSEILSPENWAIQYTRIVLKLKLGESIDIQSVKRLAHQKAYEPKLWNLLAQVYLRENKTPEQTLALADAMFYSGKVEKAQALLLGLQKSLKQADAMQLSIRDQLEKYQKDNIKKNKQ
jgi:predicted Zn-dependent protease